MRVIHRSPVDSPHKGQWRGTLMFSLICAWTNSEQTIETQVCRNPIAVIVTPLQWEVRIYSELHYTIQLFMVTTSISRSLLAVSVMLIPFYCNTSCIWSIRIIWLMFEWDTFQYNNVAHYHTQYDLISYRILPHDMARHHPTRLIAYLIIEWNSSVVFNYWPLLYHTLNILE